jgi:4-hydroxy-3-polyprenylbenzoate decarboxylase
MQKFPLLVGITGASGVIYGIRLLEALRALDVESHAMISVVHPVADIAAQPASGSFRTRGMVIAPCSVRSMSEIASGVTSSLLTRAADVTLKERRRLVLMVRETPLHTGHLRSMTALSEMGAIIAPPVPAFYTNPESLDAMVDHTIGRVLDLFDLNYGGIKRWSGPRRPPTLAV